LIEAQSLPDNATLLAILNLVLQVLTLMSPAWLCGRFWGRVGRGISRFKYWLTNDLVSLKMSMIRHCEDFHAGDNFAREFSKSHGSEFHKVTVVNDKTLHIQKSEFSGTWSLTLYDSTSETLDDLQFARDEKTRISLTTSGFTCGYRQLTSKISEAFNELELISKYVSEIGKATRGEEQYVLVAEGNYVGPFLLDRHARNLQYEVSFLDKENDQVSVRIAPGRIILESNQYLPLIQRLGAYLPYRPLD